MPLKFILTLFVLFILTSFSRAQYYETGVDPASIRWKQIKTANFRVIFPESYGEEGIKFAKSLEDSFRKLSVFYPSVKANIPVVIHNYTTNSNGYVAWAPRRMEIYPTPEQNSIPLSNIEQLTLHEMTHVLQMRTLYSGISGILSIPFGEHYYGLLAGYIPLWMLEGDAVLMETILSESGRGRTPSFLKQLKAISVERGRIYSYDKMLLGSFKNYTPDEYRYGYQMVAWASKKSGHQLFTNTIRYIGRNPFSVNPVNISLKKNASLSKARLFRETFDTITLKLGKENLAKARQVYSVINPPKGKEYINYYSPVVVGSDSIVAIKTSMYSPPVFVLLNTSTGTEKRIHTPGDIYPYFLSGAPGKVVWVEHHPDPRWENRHFSVVKILDLKKGIVKQLSHRTRYMAAAISPDGRFIAVVENTVSNKNSIVIIDAYNGEIIKSITAPENVYPQRPQWSASGNEITFISLSDAGEGVIALSVADRKWEVLKNPCRDDLQASFLRNDSLFYVSSASSVDNIWLRTPEGNELRITDSRFGIYDPYFSGGKVFFTDYSMNGNNICIKALDEMKDNFFEKITEKQFHNIPVQNFTKDDMDEYTPEPYRKWLHPFRFHSWMPFYADIEELQSDPSSIRPGFTLLSQNLLSTFITSLGYEYTGGEHLLHTRLTWKGLLPVFESRIDYGGQPYIYKPSGNISDPSILHPALSLHNSVSLPLRISNGNFTQFILPYLKTEYINRYVYIKEKNMYNYGQTEVTARIYFSNYSRSGLRDIYPKWAQIIDFSRTIFPSDKDVYGPMTTFRSALFFPGFLRNHGIRLRFESDYQKPVRLILYNRASWPRGYENIISQDLKFLSADYVMPLSYPDLNIPGLLYIKRIHSGLFYDFARGVNNTYIKTSGTSFVKGTETFRSFGIEALADFFVLRIPFIISGGLQASWKNLNEAPSLKLLLKLDVYGMMIGGYRL